MLILTFFFFFFISNERELFFDLDSEESTEFKFFTFKQFKAI